MKNEILNKICQEIEMTKNGTDVERFCELWDTAIEKYKMCGAFFGAYLESYERGLDILTFWSFFDLSGDVPTVLKNCKQFGIKEFTIAQQWTDSLALAKKFMDLGCEMVGTEKIKLGELILPAIKLKVGQ